MKRIDRTGEGYGKLTVTGPAPSQGGHSYWTCKCECGKTDVLVASANLPKTNSCGCGKEDYLVHDSWIDLAVFTRGYLLPLGFIPKSQRADKSFGRNGYWLCRCTRCHAWVKATTTQIRSGAVMGCTACNGRAQEDLVHAERGPMVDKVRNTFTRNTFYGMRRRCGDKTEKSYGGRDIKVCDRWLGPDGYRNFVADMRLRRHRRFTLDRIDVDGDYTPENCRWTDDHTQRRNKSTSRKFLVDGLEMNQCDLAKLLGMKDTALSRRINRMTSNGFTEDGAVEFIRGEHFAIGVETQTND